MQSKEKKIKNKLSQKDLAKINNNSMISSSQIICALKGKKDEEYLLAAAEVLIDNTSFFDKNPVRMIEEILIPQVYALQAVFEKAARQMNCATQWPGLQNWSVIAFKAQEQCRKTLSTLAEIKRPRKTAFIKQQNNGINQQVNNSEQNKTEKTSTNHSDELLKENKNASLDDGRKSQAVAVNPKLEAVETINRGENTSREKQK